MKTSYLPTVLDCILIFLLAATVTIGTLGLLQPAPVPTPLTLGELTTSSSVQAHYDLLDVVLDPKFHLATEVHYVLRREHLGGGKPHAYFTELDLQPFALEQSDYDSSPDWDIGHARALMLSGGSPDWREVNNLAACWPMHYRLNRVTLPHLERRLQRLTEQHGQISVTVTAELIPAAGQLPGSDEPYGWPASFTYVVQLPDESTETWTFPNRDTTGQPPESYRRQPEASIETWGPSTDIENCAIRDLPDFNPRLLLA